MRIEPGAAFWILGGIVAATAAGSALVPIAARPGYESALVLAPVAALAAGLLAVRTVVRARRAGSQAKMVELSGTALATAMCGPLAATAVLTVAGAARGFCDPVQGYGYLVVGPLACAVTAALSGVIVGLAVPGKRWPYAAVVAVLLGSLGWDVALVYATVQVKVFDHLLGVFQGPLYDEDVRLGWSHLAFRVHTLARLAPLLALAAALHDTASQRLDARRFKSRPAMVAGALALALFAATFATEPRFGLRTSARAIRAELGATTMTEHVIVHHSAALDSMERKVLAAEVEMRWRELREFFGTAPRRRLVVYMFEDAVQMRHMTGTGPTSVAKPWLGATTVVYQRSPHPILKHEMAHLFTAELSPGPLHTPGPLWGLMADPLLIEGTAVAAEWDGDPLSPHEQAAALLLAGVVQDPSAIGGLGFFTHQGGVSYLLSGSFVRFVWEEHGPDALGAWYSGAPFEQAFGETRENALARWEKGLRSLEVPAVWVSSYRVRFSSPSIFGRPCPHQVAALVGRAGEASAAGDRKLASALVDRACAIAPDDVHLGLARVRLAVVDNDADRARALIAGLERSPLAKGALEAQILEQRGDVLWLTGREQDAARAYGRALELTPQDDGVRLLAIKLWASSWHGCPGELRGYLLGTSRPGLVDPDAVLAMLGRLVEAHPEKGELLYLLGRAQINAGRWKEAGRSLEKASGANLCHPVVSGEALRLLAVALMWAEDTQGARRAVVRLEAMPPPTPALAFGARQMSSLLEALR